MSDVPLPKIPENFRFTPEFRLLAACSWIAPPALEQEQAQKIASLCKSEINWDVFITLVRRHALQALAYKLLCRHAAGQLPDGTRAALKEMAIQGSALALKQAAELTRLLDAFSRQGMELMPLKGVLLAHQLYGEVGLRNAGDIDVLVKPDDLDKACMILEAEGYGNIEFAGCKQHAGFRWTAKQRQSIRENLHHFVFDNVSKAISLELHWSFKYWLPGQLAEVLRHTRQISFNGVPALTFDDDAQLLTLCDHGAKHLWFELKWLGDVTSLLSRYGTGECATLLETAERLSLKRTLAHSALLVHWIYGIPLASEIMDLIREERTAASLSIPALDYMRSYIDNPGSKRTPLDNFWAAYHVKKSRPKIPLYFFVKPLLTSPADYQRFPLPDRFFCLYKPLRPVFWFIRNYM